MPASTSRSAAVALCVALVALAPTATADHEPLLLPPSDFTASYDATAHTVNLTWMPPGNNTTVPFVYHVYRNGDLIANTTHTWYEDTVSFQYNLYYVTAEDEDGEQSPPTEPILVQQQSSSGGGGFNPWVLFAGGGPGFFDGPCPITSIFIDSNNFPYVFVVIREECIPVIGNALNLQDPVDAVWWG